MLPIIFRGHEEAGFFAHAVGWCHGKSPLTVLPGNQRTSDARYACLIVVKDYVRLSLNSRTSGSWHYSDIEPEILADVREGRAILVFDLTNEGPAYDPSLFDPLYAWIETHRLPAGRCVWLAQNRLMGSTALNHAGTRAALIHFWDYDYFVKLVAWKLSNQGASDSNGYNSKEYLLKLLDAGQKDKLLLCLNATPRLGRVLTIAALHHHLLLQRSLVSFSGFNYIKAGIRPTDALTFLDQNPRLDFLRPWIHAVSRMPPLKVDNFQERGNELVEKIDPRAYERTFFSVVTESDFAETGIARVTEKTIKAFGMGHPAIVIGNSHSVDIVRGFGFRDWLDVIDRSSESTTDAATRFQTAMAEVLRQAQRIKADPQGWLAAVREVCIHNYQYAVSGAFLAHYVDAFDRVLVARMEMLIAA